LAIPHLNYKDEARNPKPYPVTKIYLDPGFRLGDDSQLCFFAVIPAKAGIQIFYAGK
jgi:hypothetical protein